jgi:hypothetical protein
MNAAAPQISDLVESRRKFFRFAANRGALGTAISAVVAIIFLYSDVGGMTSIMMRSSDAWLWMAFFCFDIWVTTTGITIAIGFMRLGSWSDPPADEKKPKD